MQIPSKEVYHGRNASPESDRFVRCSRCGFPCKIDRDQQAPDGSRIGWGITNESYDVVSKTYDDSSLLYYGNDNILVKPFMHFKCNDNAANTTVTDSGSGANNGTAEANTNTMDATGVISNAFELNGTTDFITINNVLDGIKNDTMGSFLFWIKPALKSIISFGDADEDTLLRIYYNNVNDRIYTELKLSGSRKWFCHSATDSADPSIWVHFAIVQDGAAPIIYINGEPDTTFTDETEPSAWLSALTGIDTGRIGTENYDSRGNVNLSTHDLDDIRYYKQYPLTADEVKAIYNSGSGTEDSTFVIDSDNNTCSVEYDEVILYDTSDEDYDASTGSLNYDGIEKTIYDPIVRAGCPQCGTLRYNK